nr:hypothetical protein BaRGS_016576 [Batillaria attramentaria]
MAELTVNGFPVVDSGHSSPFPRHWEAFKEVLQYQRPSDQTTAKLPLVRLLHESGSCPNSELHRLRNDEGIRAQLQRQGRQDILQYLDNAAANPASLQRLCRLTVAHLANCPGQSELVLRQAVSQNQWENVPKLVKSCNRPELTDLALREAVNRSQWSCVRHLVKLELLTKDQRDFICDKAISLGHFDCAVELLRQGVSPLNSQCIVFEVFMGKKWRLIVEMLRQGRFLSKEESKLVFSAAVRFRQWEAFKEVLQYQRPSDQTVREAMAAAVNTLDHDFLQTLIRSTRNGLRVLKQLCLKEQWSMPTACCVCVNLCRQEGDLAFLVAATHDLWTFALHLYEEESVNKNSRRFALRRATRRGIWHLVVQMASRGVTEQNERRRAFLGVVRQGEWSWALKLLDAGVNVKKRDVRFTVQTCLCLKLWQGVVEVCLRFDRNMIGKRLLPLVRLLHESGSCPNSELHRLRNDEGIRAQLKRQGRQDILQRKFSAIDRQ